MEKAIMQKSNQLSVEIRINKNMAKLINVNKKCHFTVSHKIDGPWHSSSLPTPFIILWQVLKDNSWRQNKQLEKQTNTEHVKEKI